MFGQMRSRNRITLPPCPCNNTCRCHLPRKGMSSFEKNVIFVLLFLFILIEGSLIYYDHKHPYKGPEYIEVNGQMCEISYHEDCVSPMSCSHKVAICKK